MTQVSTDFATGTLNSALATGDTGSPTAFDLVTIQDDAGTRPGNSSDTQMQFMYDNTHLRSADTRALKYANVSGLSHFSYQAFFQWSTAFGSVAEHWGRLYVYITAFPPSSGAIQLVRFEDASTNRNGIIELGIDGKIHLYGDGSELGTGSTNTLATNAWNRIEFHHKSGAGGAIEVKIFKGANAEGSTADETYSQNATSQGFANDAIVMFGNTGQADGTAYSLWFAQIVAGAAAYPGPAPGAPPQELAPTSDISSGNWTPSTGATLFGTIDESSFSDTDYDQSGLSPGTADVMEVKFQSGGSPGTTNDGANFHVKYRLGKSSTGGDAISVVVKLMQGATQIASWSHSNVDALTSYDQTLTNTQYNNVTDYSDLRLRFEATTP